MLGRDYGKQMFWDNVYKAILWLHQILQCNIDVASTGLPSFVTVIHEIHSCVSGAIIEMIWWNYFDVCFRLHFCEFYCVLLCFWATVCALCVPVQLYKLWWWWWWYHCYDCSRHTGMNFCNYESPCQMMVNPMPVTSLLHCSIWCSQRIFSYTCYSSI